MQQVLNRSRSDKEPITDAHDSLEASVAMRSKISLTNEFKIAIALFEIPVSGCTCLRTISIKLACSQVKMSIHTFINVRGIRLLAQLAALLLRIIPGCCRGCRLRCLLRRLGALSCLRWGLRGSTRRCWGFAGSGSGFGCHFG